MSLTDANLENFQIPLEEIELATVNFSHKNKISNDKLSGDVYRGKLSERWKNREAAFKTCQQKEEFLNELKIISSLSHENIIPFIGYCDEGNRMIIVYEYPINGSLEHHLANSGKRGSLSWAQRVQICIDVAKGLGYLHSGLGEYGSIIHGSIKKSNILLDDNLKAKICGFNLSVLIPGNHIRPHVYKPTVTRDEYGNHIDSVYLKTGLLRAESDIFSFGVLLFDILLRAEPLFYLWRGMIKVVRSCDVYGLDKLIDPVIRDQIGGRSFQTVKEIAYKCINFNIKDRPTVYTIIKTLEEALHIQYQYQEATTGYQIPRNLLFSLEEIEASTGNFCKESWLRDGYMTKLYTGQLSERWKNSKVLIKQYNISLRHEDVFRNEHDIVHRFHHGNIIPYIGYHGDEMILVFEHPVNGSLLDHLRDPNKRSCLTWEQRLKICIGAAKGLKYLHAGLWEESRVVHRRFQSDVILLDENMEAKISEFYFSILVSRYQPQLKDILPFRSTNQDYMDPVYLRSNIVNVELDMYSFGVIMFEMLSGLEASVKKSYTDDEDGDNDDDDDDNDDHQQKLIKWVHRYYEDGLDKLIDPYIRDQIDHRSLRTFSETAYKCLSLNINERPSMNRIIKRIEEALYFQRAPVSTTAILRNQCRNQDLLIPLQEITVATLEFSETSRIGSGGFGAVYKGRLSEGRQNQEAAIKRLNKTGQQGMTEFQNELRLMSRLQHQNIISFIGYCDEGDEMILVYEYASNGSLDQHLINRDKRRRLTWAQRLKICLGAAKGLDYLHSGLGDDNRVIHRDIKSGNILLDENLEAKICDFGFSKSDSANNLQQSKFYTKVAGTSYYVDPIYDESGILRAESDVYSFGVVMFEMLTGMPAWYRRKIGDGKRQTLINLVRRYYDYGKELLIDPEIKDQVDNNSFKTFIEIAHQCISFSSKTRPMMDTVVDKIEEALDFQVVLSN